jgi:hypothetical protein
VPNTGLPAHLAAKSVVPKDVQDPRTAWGGARRGVQQSLPVPQTKEGAEARVVHKRACPVRGQTAPEAGRGRRTDALDPDRRGAERGGEQERKEGPVGRSGERSLSNDSWQHTERRRPVLGEVSDPPVNDRRGEEAKTSEKERGRSH